MFAAIPDSAKTPRRKNEQCACPGRNFPQPSGAGAGCATRQADGRDCNAPQTHGRDAPESPPSNAKGFCYRRPPPAKKSRDILQCFFHSRRRRTIPKLAIQIQCWTCIANRSWHAPARPANPRRPPDDCKNRQTIAPTRKTGASPKTFPVPRQMQRRRSRTIASWILAKGAKQAAAQLRNGRGRARKVRVSRRRYSAPPKKARRRIPPPRLRALVFCRQGCGGMNLDVMFLEATPQKFAGANFYPPPQAAEGEIGFGCFVIGKIILHWGVCFLMAELQAMQRLILTGAAGGAELVGIAKADEVIAGDFRQRSQHKGARQHARMRQG